MAGQHHGIKPINVAAGAHFHAIGQPLDAMHRAGHPHLRDARQHRVDITARAALDGFPLRPPRHLQQAVVQAERQKAASRLRQHHAGRRGPDGAGHGQQIPVAHGLAIAFGVQQIAQQRVRAAARQVSGGVAVKAQDVTQHAQEGGAQQVAALCEHRTQVGARPLQVGLRQRYAERHVAGVHRNRQVLEQLHQMRIRQVVVHQKAGVDRVADAAHRGVHRIGMAADALVRFEQGHREFFRQQPSRAQSGDAAADDGDAAAGGNRDKSGTRRDRRKSRRCIGGVRHRGHHGRWKFVRAASIFAWQTQPLMWSLTMPTACMKAYIVVGPTNVQPRVFRARDRPADAADAGLPFQ